MCQAGIREVVLLELAAMAGANALEGVLVADFTQESPGGDDAKADPEAPDDAAENTNDFVTEELLCQM